VQDWHLLLLSAGIILVEIIFTIPLLTLTVVNGDARIVRDSENPTFTNVSATVRYLPSDLGLIYVPGGTLDPN
jgi:uncharacterized protein YlzI (FlbEa/FlbD family)